MYSVTAKAFIYFNPVLILSTLEISSGIAAVAQEKSDKKEP
jgi:hypothetical protein